jgi:hypothetical protein
LPQDKLSPISDFDETLDFGVGSGIS